MGAGFGRHAGRHLRQARADDGIGHRHDLRIDALRIGIMGADDLDLVDLQMSLFGHGQRWPWPPWQCHRRAAL
jgi:hypothetical protein